MPAPEEKAPVGFWSALAEILSVEPFCNPACAGCRYPACFIVSVDEVDFLIRLQLAACMVKDQTVRNLCKRASVCERCFESMSLTACLHCVCVCVCTLLDSIFLRTSGDIYCRPSLGFRVNGAISL